MLQTTALKQTASIPDTVPELKICWLSQGAYRYEHMTRLLIAGDDLLVDNHSHRTYSLCALGGTASQVDSKKSAHVCRMTSAGVLSVFGLGLEDGHVPSFRLIFPT